MAIQGKFEKSSYLKHNNYCTEIRYKIDYDPIKLKNLC